MYNRIILIGRLTRDPEFRYTPAGVAVTRFTLAVDRPAPKDAPAKKSADFIDIVTWRSVAEQAGQYLSKGRLVAVEGRLQIRSYDDRNGVRRRAAEVIATSVRFLDSPRDAAKLAPEAVDEASIPDDIPAQEPDPALAAADDEDAPF